jgi:hypothetical protein
MMIAASTSRVIGPLIPPHHRNSYLVPWKQLNRSVVKPIRMHRERRVMARLVSVVDISHPAAI